MKTSYEIEVKYLIDDLAALRESILREGFTSSGRHFESNIRFEDCDNGLVNKKQLLRLRKDTKTTLTFKSKPSENTDQTYKIQHELEVTVSDFDIMKLILEELGYHMEQVYEKWRETFRAGNALICIDEMPFGNFIEIEGSPEDIENLSLKLGFSPSKAITANYLEIFARLKTLENLPFSDITFHHFNSLNKDFTNHIRDFEAERKKKKMHGAD